mmetsp:Transcript_7013/g.18228  ORF Transcript_7013/g.18228 Transcript_7013/m.18228 type:complete len:226 (+) Transcript_7013:42-719(+)
MGLNRGQAEPSSRDTRVGRRKRRDYDVLASCRISKRGFFDADVCAQDALVRNEAPTGGGSTSSKGRAIPRADPPSRAHWPRAEGVRERPFGPFTKLLANPMPREVLSRGTTYSSSSHGARPMTQPLPHWAGYAFVAASQVLSPAHRSRTSWGTFPSGSLICAMVSRSRIVTVLSSMVVWSRVIPNGMPSSSFLAYFLPIVAPLSSMVYERPRAPSWARTSRIREV